MPRYADDMDMADECSSVMEDDEEDAPKTKVTAFTHSSALLQRLFESEGLALARGNTPRATLVMQRVRLGDHKTPLWENYGGAGAMPLSAAVTSFGGHGSYIQRHIKSAAGNAAAMATCMHHDHLAFPDVPIFSGEYVFDNGIFNLYKQTFIPHAEYICAGESCAKKHYQLDFDPDWLHPDAVHSTPQLDSIIDMQEWEPMEVELLLGMLGRLLHPVGMFDAWQCCIMLTGVGGSGKTTVTDAIVNAGFSSDQIGYISNTIEKNFPFESLVHSSVVIASDVDKDLMSNLSQTDLHKIINGERVEINIKHGGRVTLQWTAPFMLVANVVPNWQDDQGQMTRRIVYFDFSKKPPTANSQFAAQLKDPAAQVQVLLRCSKAYRELALRYQGDGIMSNILSKYYPRRAEVASKVQRNNDPLFHFIAEVLVPCPGHCVMLRTLQNYKARFCKEYEYDVKHIQFRKEFQNITASRGMKVYSMTELASCPRAKAGMSVPKTSFIDNCSVSMHAGMMMDSDDDHA